MNKSQIYRLTLKEDVGKGKFPKGSIYIGQHNGKNSNYLGSGTLITKILKSRGNKIFKKDIICEGYFNRKLIDQLEVHYIRFYNSERKNNELGLNLTAGGFGCSNHNAPKGEKSVHSKLKRKDVLTITTLFLEEGNSVQDIAKLYNVKDSCIQGVLKGRTWKHVERTLVKEDLRSNDNALKSKHYYSDELCQEIIDEFVKENCTKRYLVEKYPPSEMFIIDLLKGRKRKYLDRSKIKDRIILSKKLTNSECYEVFVNIVKYKKSLKDVAEMFSIGRRHVTIIVNRIKKLNLKINHN